MHANRLAPMVTGVPVCASALALAAEDHRSATAAAPVLFRRPPGGQGEAAAQAPGLAMGGPGRWGGYDYDRRNGYGPMGGPAMMGQSISGAPAGASEDGTGAPPGQTGPQTGQAGGATGMPMGGMMARMMMGRRQGTGGGMMGKGMMRPRKGEKGRGEDRKSNRPTAGMEDRG
jgi:hypothetical protein